MEYQHELDFLNQIFSKIHLDSVILDENKFADKKEEENLLKTRSFIKKNLSTLKEKCLYKYTDSFNLSYRFLLLPYENVKRALFIGPFLSDSISKEQILTIGEKNNFPPKQHKFLFEFYSSLPVVTEKSPIILMINTFCEKIFNTTSFSIIDYYFEAPIENTPFSKTLIDDNSSHEEIEMEAMERRYAFENELIRAVSKGQLHIESQFPSAFDGSFFERRTADPLQNAKNYCIIMNTLLRKGAENGGVHPFYINQASTDYALKIENLSSFKGVLSLMREMFRAYCRLVRKHNLRKYTPIVQKTILLIDADLSTDLSTKTLANTQGVSLGYLSAVFKKETGQTLSEYVCSRRMDYAEYLLNTTNLQIQTIALHCGIMDVQYFSKLFKKLKNKTPSACRKENKQQLNFR